MCKWTAARKEKNESISELNKTNAQMLKLLNDGYSVNLYENPDAPIFAGRITQKIPYLIEKGYWDGGEKDMICLGNEKQWAYLKHFAVQWFHADTKYWPEYQI